MITIVGLKEKDKILINAIKSCQSTLNIRGQHLQLLPKCLYQKPLINSLQYLDFSYNLLEYIPEEFSLLVNLEELYIQYNLLRHIPDVLCNLSKIRKLGIAHNQVQKIPFSLGKLLRLEWFNLSGNLVEVIPPFLFYLPRLTHLHVLRNPIKNIPRDIYIQGLMAMRKYYGVVVNNVTPPESYREKCKRHDSLCQEDTRKFAVERRECNDRNFQCTKKTLIKTQENMCDDDKVLFTDVLRRDLFSTSFMKVILDVKTSQKDEIRLIKDLRESLRISQEIRAMNLEYLQQQNIGRNLKCFTRPRPMPDIILDSKIRERYRQHMLTSEYGSLSTCTEYKSLPLHLHQNKDCDESESEDFSVYTGDGQSSMCDLGIPSSRKRHITHGEICVTIPECNQSGHLQSEFVLDIIEDLAYQPTTSMRGMQVVGSEILMLRPHGALFFKSDPAIISLPYDVKVSSSDQIICLCSDTGFGRKPQWQAMDKDSYSVFATYVEIRAEHFSLFAVVAQKQYHFAQRLIKKGVGGSLILDEVPGVEVRFPKTSLLYDIEASVKVFYADGSYDVDHEDPCAFALAAPVTELGPHGCQFDPVSPELVTVRLPLLNGKEIMEKYGDRQLTFWCSSTQDYEPLKWQQFNPKNVYIDAINTNLCSVYFSVEHFTFFKVLWDVIDAILYEAKLGASQFIPVFQFYVSCQALMSESENGVRFGLCIVCSRFGLSLEGIGNFPISVGKHPPKMISTGPLIIRVVSGLIEADTDAGQRELVHKEQFTGRQFVAQFICRYTGDFSYGSFGRVEIEQPAHGKTLVSQQVLSFNLDKPRNAEHYDSSLDWDVHLSRELAALVTIRTERDMGDEVWEDLAKSLRYTQVEINKIATSVDPMTALLANYKGRGGKPHEFISAMYNIGQIKTSPHLNNSCGSGLNTRVNEQTGTERESKMCDCIKKKRKRKRHEDIPLEDKLFEITDKVHEKWKQLGRALKLNENKLKEIEQDYKHDGVREQAYQMLLAWRDNFPDYCTLSSLSDALCKIGLVYVAREYCMVKMV